MPIKDPIKRKEYQKNWIADKRRQSVEPTENNSVEPPLKKGWSWVKCPHCPYHTTMENKYVGYFAPICSNDCLSKAQKENENLED